MARAWVEDTWFARDPGGAKVRTSRHAATLAEARVELAEARDMIENLEIALRTSREIGIAIGILRLPARSPVIRRSACSGPRASTTMSSCAIWPKA